MKNTKNKWKNFFIWWSSIAAALTVISVIATYIFERSLPGGCEACGMAAVGLVPIWLINIIAVIVLIIGTWIWLFKKTNKPYIRIGLVVIAAVALVYCAISIVAAY